MPPFWRQSPESRLKSPRFSARAVSRNRSITTPSPPYSTATRIGALLKARRRRGSQSTTWPSPCSRENSRTGRRLKFSTSIRNLEGTTLATNNHTHDPDTPLFYSDVVRTLTQASIPILLGGGFALEFHTGLGRRIKDM